MVAAFAHDLAVDSACPMASLGLGDVGADVRSRSVGAAASHFYCSIDKIGQVATSLQCDGGRISA
eukprot:2355171-Prorocentrum_lima.AAC.1